MIYDFELEKNKTETEKVEFVVNSLRYFDEE